MLKKLSTLFLVIGTFAFSQEYIYSENGEREVSFANGSTTIYSGTPAKVIESLEDKVKISISGFIKPKEKNVLYATKNYKLALVKGMSSKMISGDLNEEVKFFITIPKVNLTTDVELAWEYEADVFYEKCSSCHNAPQPHHFDMLTWGGVYSGMKARATPTKEEEVSLLRYVYAHSSDGIVEEH